MTLFTITSLIIFSLCVIIFIFSLIDTNRLNKMCDRIEKRLEDSKSSPVMDKDGNIYIENMDNTITKFDSDGNELWTTTAPAKKVDNIGLDNQGNVYVSSYDQTVHKIDPNGNEIWTIEQGNINSP